MRVKTNKTIWLLSAYRSQSHAAWVDWLTQTFTDIHWYTLELPGRHFRWRIRGNPLSWLNKLPQETPDLILATSMVDLATLKGLHPRLANIPVIYYFHENQFAYPTSKQQHGSVDPQMVQLYGAIAANQLVFNSNYNRETFLSGIDKLLQMLPDEVPDNITNNLRDKSKILPVAIKPIPSQKNKIPGLILWNHRWEYDKAPEVFADALIQLNNSGIDFKLALLGERANKTPDALRRIEMELHDKIIINEKVNKEEYQQYLSQSSIVVSTAIHEFQGLAIMEAVSAGAIPLVPDDLCYREQYAEVYRYTTNDSIVLTEKLSHFLNATPAPPDISNWFESKLEDEWRRLLLIDN
jgi:glycosyltransferase involved in cell wall biosynthesis